MGFLDGIGGALSSAWNATIGQAVKAVTNIFSPPPPPAPTMVKDSVNLTAGASDWEKSANIIAGNTSRIVGSGGANAPLGVDFGNVVSNNGASFSISVARDGERNMSGNNPGGGVYDTQLGNHDTVILGDGVKVGVDGGVVIHKGDRTIVAEGSKTGPNGETIPLGETKDITDILKGKGQILGNNSGGILGNNAGGIISHNGGSLIGNNGAGIIDNNSAGIISGNTARIIDNNSAGIISGNTARIISDKGGS